MDLRIRAVGLREDRNKAIGKASLIMIWNPTEKQQVELIEGQAYAVSGLLPMNSNTNTLKNDLLVILFQQRLLFL
ncbi:hypothetical protein K2173_002962 [Erythroxylum novogranatense]|uniref:Uncharacterized protein n=1 Tax=Erythroxylum novogranatense TaxID=1862640 RepID=A0AAV8TRE3_9ROSI|nr:hypothetical protein K2173_002962 [Erythroxylum novogranatense]